MLTLGIVLIVFALVHDNAQLRKMFFAFQGCALAGFLVAQLFS